MCRKNLLGFCDYRSFGSMVLSSSQWEDIGVNARTVGEMQEGDRNRGTICILFGKNFAVDWEKLVSLEANYIDLVESKNEWHK